MKRCALMVAGALTLCSLVQVLWLCADRVSAAQLMRRQAMTANEFVVMDERGQPRARFETVGSASQVVFFDQTDRERLRIGLRPDGTPSILVEGRELLTPGGAENRG